MISIFFFFLILLGRARLVVGSPYDEWDESRTGCLDNAVKQNEDMEHSWTKLCVLGFSSFLIGAQSKCDGEKSHEQENCDIRSRCSACLHQQNSSRQIKKK